MSGGDATGGGETTTGGGSLYTAGLLGEEKGATGAAGVISEYYLPHIPSVVRSTLETHKNYGILTGALLTIARVFRSRCRMIPV